MTSIDDIKTIFNPATCLRRGLAPVSTSQKRSPAPHNLYFEVHGDAASDAVKLVFIMGKNFLPSSAFSHFELTIPNPIHRSQQLIVRHPSATPLHPSLIPLILFPLFTHSFAWHHQVTHFSRKPGYQILVFDNRGVGNSDTPPGRLWKTSEMALDAVDLLDYLGWTGKRELNVVGVSMGGMIAQELALAIPDRIASLNLTSTKCGDRSDRLTLALLHRALFFGKLMTNTAGTPEQILSMVIDTLFPQAYLQAIDPKTGEANKVAVQKDFEKRVEMGKLQSTAGKVGQMMAVLGHCVKADRLKIISSTIPKVAIIHGDMDELIDVQRGVELHEMIPGSEFKLVKGAGHAILAQLTDEYNAFIESVVEDAKRRVAEENERA
ncbi:hypothetical protein P7C70_g4841, partial [Phenoliferia sp. Uapishka_3]